MILNMSQINRETGKSYVTIVGEDKDGKTTQYKRNISELTPKDLENLRKMGKSEGDDIRKISSATQGANEKLEGIKKNADELKKECRSVPDPRGKYAELKIIEDYDEKL